MNYYEASLLKNLLSEFFVDSVIIEEDLENPICLHNFPYGTTNGILVLRYD